jgi:voltage-gated potassium channel
VKFVRGDYFSQLSLERANVGQARKVLVMADTLESSAVSEVDSKTVMAVLTIKSLARDVYVTAEILDRKYESYLQQAMCDEILFSRDFSRLMLANASATSGLSHILYALLARESENSVLYTKEIPERYVGGHFGDLRRGEEQHARRRLLGLLENSGSPAQMKLESLREAQKTSDVSQLIDNLKKVKRLQVNKPVFLPEDEYLIQSHSLAIVLERMGTEGESAGEAGDSGSTQEDLAV